MGVQLSSKKNVLQLLALMHQKKITRVVVCPGSRNAPLVHSFAAHPDFECREVTDERSAAFIAMGWIQQTKAPVAVCCTSGSALLNFSPAVAEAYYQELPLLVISADRPSMWINQMDGQTLPQDGALSRIVEKSVQLIEPKNQDEAWYCNRLINEGLLSLQSNKPVHINIPITEPLFEFKEKNLPQERGIEMLFAEKISALKRSLQQQLISLSPSPSRILCVIGQDSLLELPQTKIEKLRQKGILILAEHLANVKSDVLCFEEGLKEIRNSKEKVENYIPDLLITLGGHIVSKQLKLFLRKNAPKTHWHFTSDKQQVSDLYQHLTLLIPSTKREAVTALAALDYPSNSPSFIEKWKAFDANKIKNTDWNERTVLQDFIINMPKHATLQVANSSSVRWMQRFLLPDDTHYYVNRGVNGIEGTLSTAVGYAANSERLTFVVIGDLSFFYDINALWNKYHKGNLRILLLNNKGGKIFSKLPQAKESPYLETHIAGAHNTSAEAVAQLYDCIYASAKNQEELKERWQEFVLPTQEKTSILEINL